MRYVLPFIAILLMCNPVQAKKTIFSGHVGREGSHYISLSYYANPLDHIELNETVRGTTLDEHKNFSLVLDLEHPITIKVLNTNADEWLATDLIICPGDSVFISFGDTAEQATGRGATHYNFSFGAEDRFMTDPGFYDQLANSHVQLDPLPYAIFHNKYRREQLNWLKLWGTELSPKFKKMYRYAVNYDYGVRILRYAWMDGKAPQHLFRNKQYLAYLDSIQLNNSAALASDQYVDMLKELPFDMLMSHLNKSAQIDPANEYYLQNKTKIRDSIAQHYFKGAVYDMALYAILYDNISQLKYTEKDAPQFNDQYMHALQDLQTFGGQFNNDTLAGRLERKLLDHMQRGTPAPDFTAVDEHDNPVSLSDYKGKVVYLTFLTTDSKVCMQETEAAQQLQQSYANTSDNLVFLYVFLDEHESDALSFIRDRQFPGTHLFAPKGLQSDAATQYHLAGVPRYVLIDKSGKLITGDAPSPTHNPAEMIYDALQKEL